MAQHVDRLVQFLCWTPIPIGIFKLNTNGSVFGNPSVVGFGRVLWKDDGKWTFEFSGLLGDTIMLHAELYVLLQGLHLAKNYGVRSTVCSLVSGGYESGGEGCL